MSDSGDFDRQAAWLRRFHADARSNLKAFALRLKEAMPELVTIRESGGFFSRAGQVTGVAVALGNHLYTLDLANGRLKASVAMVVRGITLNTKEVDPGDWFAQLSRETRDTTARAQALSQSLAAFMER
jgi:hypothetical protein